MQLSRKWPEGAQGPDCASVDPPEPLEMQSVDPSQCLQSAGEETEA